MNENDDKPFDVAAFFEHSGVKGMKWGVRNKSKGSGGGNFFDYVNAMPRKERRAETKILMKDAKWSGSVMKQKDGIKVHNATAKRMNETHLPELNGRPAYKGKNLGANSKLLAKYHKDYTALVEKAASDAIDEVHGTSPSGRMKATLGKDPSGQMYVEIVATDPKAVWHAQINEPLPDNTVRFHLTTDENGFFTSMDLSPTNVKHSDNTFDVVAFFEHSGVRGMRWGVRKESHSVSRGRTRMKSRYMTTEELQKAIQRIEIEKKYNSLTSGSTRKGRSMVKSVLGEIGKKAFIGAGSKFGEVGITKGLEMTMGAVRGKTKTGAAAKVFSTPKPQFGPGKGTWAPPSLATWSAPPLP